MCLHFFFFSHHQSPGTVSFLLIQISLLLSHTAINIAQDRVCSQHQDPNISFNQFCSFASISLLWNHQTPSQGCTQGKTGNSLVYTHRKFFSPWEVIIWSFLIQNKLQITFKGEISKCWVYLIVFWKAHTKNNCHTALGMSFLWQRWYSYVIDLGDAAACLCGRGRQCPDDSHPVYAKESVDTCAPVLDNSDKKIKIYRYIEKI